MSGNANRSLTDRIRMASNRTNYWYKLQLEEQRRVHPDNVERPILADPSEERVLYERMGSLAIYRDGVLYLAAPALPIVDTSGEIPPIPPTPESIWWVTNFDTSGSVFSINNNNIILNSTNEINNNYMTRLFSYGEPASYFYNRDGTLLKDLNASTRPVNTLRYVDSLLTFTSKDGKSMNLLHFRGGYTGFFNSRTFNFTVASITPRIATTSSRTYSALFYNAFTDPAVVTTPLQILDISDNIVAQINTDVSGSSSARFDSALIITDQNGNYITNASMRTTDLSDNNAGNSIAVRGINTFSDGSVIVAGDFATHQIVFYNAADVSMGQLTIPVRKTSGANNNRDIFMAAFDTNGTLRYYNYIRSTNINPGQNEFDSSIAIDSSNNAYIVGTFINAGTDLMQFFEKNTSLTPLTDVVYDTSGFQFAGNPANNCNFSTNMVFVSKYDYSGNFQWFAPIGTNNTDLSGDVSYLTRTTSTGVVLSMLYASTTGSLSSTLNIYNGKTVAQRNTPGVLFRNVPLLSTSLYNNLIIKYDFNGNGLWVKQIRGDIHYGGPTSAPSPTNIGHPIPLVSDSSNNIYSVSSVQGSGSYPVVQLWNIGPSGNMQMGGTVGPSSGSNPYIVSLSDSGNLNWYGLLNINGPIGTYCFNTCTTSQNELVLLCNTFANSTLTIYNPEGSPIKTQDISGLTSTVPYLLIYKLASNGTTPGTTVQYIISQSTSAMNIRINNGISIDSSNNLYVTAELNSTSPAIGQTLDLLNQDNDVVATITKRSANQYEYFTVKIPASFTQE